jgi:hypothetical protein
MGLRSDEEKRPLLRERRQADDLVGRWALVGSACGGAAVLDPALAAGAVPLGILCGVFAYRFNCRKAACDEVIDDPPRSDYTTFTRRQRDWFDPERLDAILSPVQVRLCKLLGEGDADLRAAVRADERAQGAFAAQNSEYSHLQGAASDKFIDAFVVIQDETGRLVEEVRQELRQELRLYPGWSAVSAARRPGGGRFLAHELRVERSSALPPADLPGLAEPARVGLARALPPEAVTALQAAGISSTALGSIDVPRDEEDPNESIVQLSSGLMRYAKAQRGRAQRLSRTRQSRPSPLERLEAREDRPGGRSLR